MRWGRRGATGADYNSQHAPRCRSRACGARRRAVRAGNCSFLRGRRASRLSTAPCGSRHAGGEGSVPGGAAQARAAVGGGRGRHGAVQAQGAAPQVGVAGEAGEAAAGGAGGGAAARGGTADPALAPRPTRRDCSFKLLTLTWKTIILLDE